MVWSSLSLLRRKISQKLISYWLKKIKTKVSLTIKCKDIWQE
jgi:hypothetical protein